MAVVILIYSNMILVPYDENIEGENRLKFRFQYV